MRKPIPCTAAVFALIALLLASAGVARAQRNRAAANIHFMDESGKIQRGIRCATRPVGRAEQASVRREVESFIQRYSVQPPGDSIPVAFQPGQNHNVDRAVLVRRFIE